MAALTAIAVAGIGLSLLSQRQAKKDAQKRQAGMMAFDIKSAKLESKALLEEAALEAIEIRREGVLLGKTQTALTAKAGLKLGRGTARDIQAETKRLTEKDVATTLEAAQRKSEQILETYGAGEEDTERFRGRELRERKKGRELTALEGGQRRRSSNFMQSEKLHVPFGDL